MRSAMPGESSKGIFPAPASHGLALRSRNRIVAKARLDAFAELLAEGHEPGAAAVILGHLPDYGRVLLQRIRKRLGPQAI
jgi:hypothetical protein